MTSRIAHDLAVARLSRSHSDFRMPKPRKYYQDNLADVVCNYGIENLDAVAYRRWLLKIAAMTLDALESHDLMT